MEEENRLLKMLQDDSDSKLARGAETVEWTLGLDDFEFNKELPKLLKIKIDATWDELLFRIFPGGYSDVDLDEVKTALFQMILDKAPKETGSERWRDGTKTRALYPVDFPKYSAVEKLLTDIHRQFLGLGLITETRERVTKVTRVGPQPRILSVWHLSPKGAKYVARLRGFAHAD